MGTLYSKQAKAWSPVRESDVGNLQCAIGYVAAADNVVLNQNDVVQMVKVPVGATVVDCFLDINNAGAVNVAVGDDDSAILYITNTSAATAARIVRNGPNAGVPKTYTAEDTIDITFSADDPTDNIAFCLYVLYVCGLDVTPY